MKNSDKKSLHSHTYQLYIIYNGFLIQPGGCKKVMVRKGTGSPIESRNQS